MQSREYNRDLEGLLARAREGDKCAQSAIAEENMGLVRSVVKRFENRGHDCEDLFQIGCIGLIKAIKNFDSEYGVKFSTYAVPMIMGEIKRFIRDDGIIKVSRSLKELAINAMRLREQLEKEHGAEPTVRELALQLGVSPEELATALEAGVKPESIYSTRDDGGKEMRAPVERLESGENSENDIVNRLLVRGLLDGLEVRERTIIVMRYFKGKTQAQIAEMLGISQVQVSRIEKKVLGLMRESLEDKNKRKSV